MDLKVPSCLGRRPIPDCVLLSNKPLSHAVKLAPPPLSIDPKPTHLRLPAAPFLPAPRGADGCCCCNAAAGAAAIFELTAAAVAPHRAPWAAHHPSRCCSASCADRLHVGGSHHIVMSPSEALATLLKSHDHCFNWLVMLLLRATCGACGQMVT